MSFGRKPYGKSQGGRRSGSQDGEDGEQKRSRSREEQLHHLFEFPEEEPQEVTLVELLQRPRHSYRIYFGPHYVTVHESTMIRYGMTKGSFFNKDMVHEIVRDNERQIAYAQAINYLSFKPRTSGEIEQKLLEKEIDPEAAADTVRRLEEEKLVDDAAYAQEWAYQRVTGRKKGKVLVKQELRRKGIDQELIDDALDALDDDDEMQSAEELAAKKWRTTKGDTWDRKRKTAAFIMRRGFSSDIARKAVDRVLSHEGEDSEDLGTEFD
ncbi:regulatory protein RecX [Saccharibacillus kuerlensis]|uniref:Regulatory protein RecX n=1 Tax=Saccharibacillus kuerlensis TaxID=459527 RepID=A0ABQ2KQ77_9BACL|nr:RecX family transcriptional regulator [Saccharibacillus kuerlensis]GGN90153.1 regulatory protein RecX [Saccharibacillus kuerlensis]